MCHLVLLMPVVGLPIFWIMPPSLSIPIYLVILLISGLMYRLIAKAMRKTPETGVERLIGTDAEVVSKLNPGHSAQYLVRSQGELWSARSADVLQPGETIQIADLKGIVMVVERKNNGSHPD